MTLRIGRTLPPAAAPIPLFDVLRALPACFRHETDVPRFAEEIRQVFGQRYCLLVSSGKAALVLILKALHNLYPERDEVLISAFTCYSVPAAIKKAGLRIKLCDTGKGALDFDQEQLRTIIETKNKDNKVLCVIVTHLFGCPADFANIKAIVGDKIPLVEDAAQAMGEEIDNKKIGTLGDAGFFSLGRGKALSTMEGGVIVTNREDLGDELARIAKELDRFTVTATIILAAKTIIMTLLQQPFIFWLPKALPFLRLGETIFEEKFPICAMSSFQVRLARGWQKRLQGHQKARSKNIQFWQKSLPQNLTLVCPLKKATSLIRLPVLAPSSEDREMICRKGKETGCGVMPTYPTIISEIPKISSEFVLEHYPNAKQLADCLLTLPVHEYLQESDRIKIHALLELP